MDDLRQINLNLMLVLHVLLTEKHVTRSAARLNKSQPAVSHALAQLRSHFADPLLVRDANGAMVLTARAQQLVLPLEEALRGMELLLTPKKFDPSRAKRTFRMSLSDYAARTVLPGLVRRTRRMAPGIDLAVSQTTREGMTAQLLDGEIDLALGVFPQPPASIRTLELFKDTYVSVCDRDVYPEPHKWSFDEWVAKPHMLVAVRADGLDEIDNMLSATGARRRIALVLPHWGVASELLGRTDLVLTIAKRAASMGSIPAHLVHFSPPFDLPDLSYRCAWHPRSDADMAHQWLRNNILQSEF